MNTTKLGINIDHVATIREARGVTYPNPVEAALVAARAGADNITMHLREDRRHIQDNDVQASREELSIPLNLEMAATEAMITFACKVKPAHVCLVPEKREELTTEGGLDVIAQQSHLESACVRLQAANIEVSFFVDPVEAQIKASLACGARTIELHTGEYANAYQPDDVTRTLSALQQAAKFAHKKGLTVHAGHGLHYHNVRPIAAIPEISTLNIGHSIVAHAVFVGMPQAIKDMRELMQSAMS